MLSIISIRKYISRITVMMGFFGFLGCDDFIEVDNPNSQLTSSAIFDNPTTANAAMADIYAQMRENGVATGKLPGFSALLGAYADEFISYESGSYSTADFYNNSLLASNAFVADVWDSSYKQVYAANAILEGIAGAASLPQQNKDQLQGEALFVRAFIHFSLANVFGAIPYIKTTDYVANRTVARMPIETVYRHTISDLENAIALLPVVYLQPNRTRPNKSAAQALLARVYLYHGDYAEAANMASAVLNESSLFDWETDIDRTFLKESSATVWQLAPGSNGSNTYEGSTFIFLAGPPSTVALSESFVAGFETGDLRKTHWIKAVTDGAQTWYHPYKYKQDTSTGSSAEYSIILRIGELHLIRAEARVRQGELITAKDDLNLVRFHAGLGESAATTQEEILEAILQERRSELFTEQGHRFFDLKRFGRLDETIGSKAGWNANDVLWPLPQSELRANPFLSPQNPGY